MHIGLDRLTAHLEQHHRGQRVGLLCHQASVASDGRHAIEILKTNTAWQLTTFFGPEHGIEGLAADMEDVGYGEHGATGLPIHSLYGATTASLQPSPTALDACDVLVIDLQDIGTRYYTYIYTMAFCLEACAKAGKPVIVCDRPNPIDGVTVEGPLGSTEYRSFVGWHPLPVRHGMTIGELARYFNETQSIGAELAVLEMDGWRRSGCWDKTGLPWIPPSPNMRSVDAAILYPGLCLLEGTNVSEGRGTDTPFQVCGAPWVDREDLAEVLGQFNFPGVCIASTRFVPSERKFAGKTCNGITIEVTDRHSIRPYAFGLALLYALADLDEFQWRTPQGNPPHAGLDAGPYEFNTEHPAIDLLTGGKEVRECIDGGGPWPRVQKLAGPTPENFLTARKRFLISYICT